MATVDELKSGRKFLSRYHFILPYNTFSIYWNETKLLVCMLYFLLVLVLKETLENRGVLGQIRARVRAEVFGALDDQVRTSFIVQPSRLHT